MYLYYIHVVCFVCFLFVVVFCFWVGLGCFFRWGGRHFYLFIFSVLVGRVVWVFLGGVLGGLCVIVVVVAHAAAFSLCVFVI